MARLPPLNALRAFEVSARLGSFTLAGKELHVTHGAISQQIRILEDALSVSLFFRHGNRIELTKEGIDVYETTRKSMRLLEDIPHILRQSDALRGEVSVSAPASFLGHWFVHQLGHFSSLFPDLRLRLVPSNDDREVQSRDIDICIRYGNGAWPGRNVELLTDVFLFPVYSPQLLSAGALRRRRKIWAVTPFFAPTTAMNGIPGLAVPASSTTSQTKGIIWEVR